jgi:3-oxoacyl-[acyl-carrier protein] reductase
MFDLSGKTALVTGASGGIGQAIARALHAQGASVALSGTRRDVLEALQAELGGRTQVLVCDLADGAAVDALPGQAEAALGWLDIVVHNAGITRDNLFLRMKDDEWDQVLQVNLSAAFRLFRGAVRGMMRRRAGRLIGMAKSLAQEVASRGITVNTVAPGFIASPMTDALSEKQRESILARVPAARLGEGREVAAATVYLASDEAAYVTGQTLHINGGMAMI